MTVWDWCIVREEYTSLEYSRNRTVERWACRPLRPLLQLTFKHPPLHNVLMRRPLHPRYWFLRRPTFHRASTICIYIYEPTCIYNPSVSHTWSTNSHSSSRAALLRIAGQTHTYMDWKHITLLPQSAEKNHI